MMAERHTHTRDWTPTWAGVFEAHLDTLCSQPDHDSRKAALTELRRAAVLLDSQLSLNAELLAALKGVILATNPEHLPGFLQRGTGRYSVFLSADQIKAILAAIAKAKEGA